MSSHRNRVVVCATDELFSKALGHALHDFEVEIVDQERLLVANGEALVWKINGAIPSNTSEVAARLPTLMLGGEQHLLNAVDAGCRGFLGADASIEEIRSAVLTISNGGAVIPPSMLGSLLRHVVQRRRAADILSETLASLTSREFEVYELAARGLGREQSREPCLSALIPFGHTCKGSTGSSGFTPVRNWQPFPHMAPVTIWKGQNDDSTASW